MSRPPGLTWHDRIGTDERRSRWWFDCHRKGHPKVFRVFDLKSAAKEFRTVHDATFHCPGLIPRSIQMMLLGAAFACCANAAPSGQLTNSTPSNIPASKAIVLAPPTGGGSPRSLHSHACGSAVRPVRLPDGAPHDVISLP